MLEHYRQDNILNLLKEIEFSRITIINAHEDMLNDVYISELLKTMKDFWHHYLKVETYKNYSFNHYGTSLNEICFKLCYNNFLKCEADSMESETNQNKIDFNYNKFDYSKVHNFLSNLFNKNIYNLSENFESLNSYLIEYEDVTFIDLSKELNRARGILFAYINEDEEFLKAYICSKIVELIDGRSDNKISRYMIDLNIVYFYRDLSEKPLEELIMIYKDLSLDCNEEKRAFYSVSLISYNFFKIANKKDDLIFKLKEIDLYSNDIEKVISEINSKENESLYSSETEEFLFSLE